MKILFDPIITNDPKYCVMYYKMQQAARYLLDRHDDLFIRFTLPTAAKEGFAPWEIDYDWLLTDPRVEYVEVPTYTDRMKEYYRLDEKLRWSLMFNGPYWDTDVLITSRLPMVPIMKVNMTAGRASTPWARAVVTVEDMPIMSFKTCVMQVQSEVQDVNHVASYAAADLNLFVNPWERDQMLRVAKGVLSPSLYRELAAKSVGTVPVKHSGFVFKPTEAVDKIATGAQRFTVGYTQRFDLTHRKSLHVLKTMERHWVYRGGKGAMRFVCTSNSKGIGNLHGKGIELSGIEFMRPPREEFWRFLREEVSVVIVLTQDDGYALSMLEPILNGTPAIVQRAVYSEIMLGKDYPFFVSGDTEAYSLVKVFMDDYAAMYAKFMDYCAGTLDGILRARDEHWFPPHLDRYLRSYRLMVKERMSLKEPNNEVAVRLSQIGDDLVVEEALASLGKSGDIRGLAQQASERVRDRKSWAFSADLNHYRLLLNNVFGFRDASLKTGHLTR